MNISVSNTTSGPNIIQAQSSFLSTLKTLYYLQWTRDGLRNQINAVFGKKDGSADFSITASEFEDTLIPNLVKATTANEQNEKNGITAVKADFWPADADSWFTTKKGESTGLISSASENSMTRDEYVKKLFHYVEHYFDSPY